VKSTDEAAKTEIDRIVYLCAESIRIVGILLQPIMPDTMSTLLSMLGVSPSARTFEYATIGADYEYGTNTVELGRGHIGVLFPPLSSDF